MSRRTSATMVALLTLVMAFSTAMAAFAQYPPGPAVGSQAECARGVVPPGASLSCGASGFAPASEVSIFARGNLRTDAMAPLAAGSGTTILASAPLAQAAGQWTWEGTATADENGTVTVAIPVPENADGPAEVSFSGFDAEGNAVTVGSDSVAVDPALAADDAADSSAAVADDSAELTATGGQFTIGLTIALAVLVVGAGALFASRRRADQDVTA